MKAHQQNLELISGKENQHLIILVVLPGFVP